MTVSSLRKSVSVVFIGGHFSASLLVVYFLLRDWIDSTDATLFFSIAIPALTPYTTLAFKHYLHRMKHPGPRQADSRSVELGLLIMTPPICLLTVLFAVILAKVFFHRFDTVERFAQALLLGETLFGLYTAMLVDTLFGR